MNCARVERADQLATNGIVHVIDKVRLQRYSLLANIGELGEEGRKGMFYLTTHSTHFIYGYMASDIW